MPAPNIMDTADRLLAEARSLVGADASATALAVALGRLAAEAGLDLEMVHKLVDIVHSEAQRAGAGRPPPAPLVVVVPVGIKVAAA